MYAVPEHASEWKRFVSLRVLEARGRRLASRERVGGSVGAGVKSSETMGRRFSKADRGRRVRVSSKRPGSPALITSTSLGR